MAIGGYLRKLLSSTNPRPEDFRYPADREETMDKSPQYMEEMNEAEHEPSSTMKDYLDGVDDSGHVSVDDNSKKSSDSPMQSDAASTAKAESNGSYIKENLSEYGSQQDPNEDIKQAMRRSILAKLSGEYY